MNNASPYKGKDIAGMQSVVAEITDRKYSPRTL